MSDGTVKVTAEAHLHITQLMGLLQGPLSDVLGQITSNGLALTDPNVWAGPAASTFTNQVWPTAQQQLDAVRTTLAELQQQVAGILSNITAAGGAVPGLGAVTGIAQGLPLVGSLTQGLPNVAGL